MKKKIRDVFKVILFLILISMINLHCELNRKISKNDYSEELSKEETFEGDAGTFIDKRDGNEYKWVRVGEQIWMAENLRYKAPEGCSAYKNRKRSVQKMGYYYDWHTAQTVAPEGWRLPSSEDYDTLICHVVNWKGCDLDYYRQKPNRVAYEAMKVDTFGLNFIDSGIYDFEDGRFYKAIIFKITMLWTSDPIHHTETYSTVYFFTYGGFFKSFGTVGSMSSKDKLPVRCIKNKDF